ncbi:MAG: LCP family protein [Oscillospiraceae bacterium]|nr:LCP family protein [Oscillospiraceae bacterium]
MAMTNSYKRRGPKPGSTAIPFMITILVSLLVFGGVAFYFYNKLTEKTRNLQQMQSSTKLISDEDINTILFILKPGMEERKNAYMTMRFNPVKKQIMCIGLPDNLQMNFEGRTMTLSACYENHGPVSLKAAVAETLQMPVDRYIELDSQGFQSLVNILGNVNYVVGVKDTGLKESTTPVTLDNKQYETLLTTMKYANEQMRASVIGDSVATLLNDCIGDNDRKDVDRSDNNDQKGTYSNRVARNIDAYFNSVINAVTTDITMMDFEEHRHAITYIFEYGAAPAIGPTLICTPGPDGTSCIADENCLRDLRITADLLDDEDDDKKDSAKEAPAQEAESEQEAAPAESEPAAEE